MSLGKTFLLFALAYLAASIILRVGNALRSTDQPIEQWWTTTEPDGTVLYVKTVTSKVGRNAIKVTYDGRALEKSDPPAAEQERPTD